MLKKLFALNTTSSEVRRLEKIEELDYDRLPILHPKELITYTNQQNRLNNIKRIVGIDKHRFEILYLSTIENFADTVQLMPASQAHHHAVPGGLFIHTLEVIEHALSLRRKYKLPAFAEPEVQTREDAVWTYAVFIGCILHDVGKRLTMCSFICESNNRKEIFSPYEGPISNSDYEYYQIAFNDAKYYPLHEKIGLTFIDLIPPIGRKFLFTNLHIVQELVAYIHDDKFNSGVIGTIISEADKKSTGHSLAHSPTRKFKGASTENIGERLMTHLRTMIASNELVVNKSNASVYILEDYTYLVSKTVIDAIKDSMREQNEKGIPNDNMRIMDIFQEYNFAETNRATGNLVHYIRIYHQDQLKTLSVLKFKTNKLIQRISSVFDGQIEEISNTEHKSHLKNTKNSNTKAIQPEPINSEEFMPETNQENSKSIEPNETDLGEDILSDILGDDIGATAYKSPTPALPRNKNTKIDESKKTENKHIENIGANVIDNNRQDIEPNKNQSSPDLLDFSTGFINWCHKELLEKNIIVNQSRGMIMKVAYKDSEAIGLVTPRTFIQYGQTLGMPNERKTADKIQGALHKEKIHIPGPRGQFHTYLIKKSHNNKLNSNIPIRLYLFTIENFSRNNNELLEILKETGINENLVHD